MGTVSVTVWFLPKIDLQKKCVFGTIGWISLQLHLKRIGRRFD